LKRIAIIGGTGVVQFDGLHILKRHSTETPYGATSRSIEEGKLHGCSVFFLQRHGAPEAIPPHKVNYRANMWALQSLGVSHVVAINAVGGINPNMATGSLVVPDQIIDYTWGREHSIDDGGSGEMLHIDFTQPYDEELRQSILNSAEVCEIPHHASGVHAVTQGPRLETAAEILRLEADGCDIVGMTGMPEASLARELGMAYAAICMVVNPAAGKADAPISLAGMRATLAAEAEVVQSLLDYLLRASASA
jgi:5'-methylthioinosine phosphorylase